MSGRARVLVLEDEGSLREILCETLRERGHDPVSAATVAEGQEALESGDVDVALLDLQLPDGSGIDLLRKVREEQLPVEAIVLTGHADVGSAIEAMKLGAYDYLVKPLRIDELEALVDKALEKARLRRENVSLRLRLERLRPTEGIVTEDSRMLEVMKALERIAASELPVLVQGESGTGKELIARAVHSRSPRASAPFVPLNCAAVPENLIESELFGFEKGAFTGALQRKQGLFELADRGVLFLDEIGELPSIVQVKLLRAVETREFFRVGGTRPVRSDIRLVSATNKDLKQATQTGEFREDLYFRLNGVTLSLPPLRERRGDVALLATHFLKGLPGGRRSLSRRAIEKLQGYAWPGNVRELQMVIRRAAVLSPKETLDAEDIPLDRREPDWRAQVPSGMTLAQMEREYIQRVLAENAGHRGRTALALGIDVKTLYNKLGPERPRRNR
ncbi:MAG: sigma-54-dependent transcriptional regulator [Vicinamibacteria bacterium]